jgi:hypothetical protein
MGIEVDGANQKLILDSDGDTYIEGATDDTLKVYVSGAQDFTITANTLTAESGSTIAAQALTATTVTASGIVKTDDATEATSTTDGSLQTDGGLSVVKDVVFGDDVKLLSDASVIHFGANSEVTLTHSHDAGLNLKHTATADDKPVVLTLQTGETDMAANDVIGKIAFQAPDEATGTDAVLVAAAIQAVSEGDFSSSANATRIEFMVGASEAAAKKMQLTSAGKLEIDGGLDVEGGVVFNEDSADVDFRVESNGSANMLVVNGGDDKVGIGTNSPAELLTLSSNDPNIRMIDTNTDSYSQLTNANGTITIEADKGAGSGSSEIRFTVDNTQRASIDSNGIFKSNNRVIIDNDVASGFKLNIEAGGNTETGIIINDKDAASGFTFNAFRRSGTEIGSISRNGTNDAVLYTTSSDYRLKDGIVDKTDGIEKIKLLKPRKFYWKSNTDKTLVDGFIAHEVSDIVPEAISGEKDGMTSEVLYTADDPETQGDTPSKNVGDVKESSKIAPQGIDQSNLVPLLTAALKESIAKIEALEARVTTLEG